MASWYIDTIAPLIRGGADSAWYMGVCHVKIQYACNYEQKEN